MTCATVLKHEAFDLKHMLQLFASPSELLFSCFEAYVKQYCLRRLQKQTKATAVDSTAIAQKRTRTFQSYRQLSE
jgi:hypothetical protein